MTDLLPPLPALVVPATARPSAAKAAAKAVLHALATAAVLPWLVCYRVAAALLGRDRALEGASQALACLPGLTGVFLRRAFLARVLTRCDRSAEVSFGTLFSQAGAVIEANVYVGPRCHLGLVHLERDVLIAAGVHIPSGGRTHYAADPTVPIKDQGGERRAVRIGAGAWIGSAAVVLADVGRGTIVGAGSVVTRPLPDDVIAAGVPAKVIRPRFARGPGILDEGTS
jgi:acetyltransferase-like isoleucine patch superfamily enzyme